MATDQLSKYECWSTTSTKWGPFIWLFYVHDLAIEKFYVVKYTDGTTIYRPVCNLESAAICNPTTDSVDIKILIISFGRLRFRE